MKYFANQLIKVVKHKYNGYYWNFFNQTIGFSKLKKKSTIEKKQILGCLAKYSQKNDLSSLKLDDFLPFNIVSTFYR